MTGEQFILLDGHELMSLVYGVAVVEETERTLRHGEVFATVGGALYDFVKANRLGRVCSNNTSVRLRRNPDTVYGPDLCYFSYARMPKGGEPEGVCDIIPELVVEVRMPSNDHWRLIVKAGDYVMAGIHVAMIVDPESETVMVVRDRTQTFHNGDVIELPDVLPGFALPLQCLFE